MQRSKRSTFLKGAALSLASLFLLGARQLRFRHKRRLRFLYHDAGLGSGVNPSILLTITDDQPFYTVENMANLKNMLTWKGTTFSRAYAGDPLCDPSRCCILLGKNSLNHGMYNNDPPNGGMGVFRDGGWESRTFLQYAKNAGYDVGYFGKTLHHDWGHLPEGVDKSYTFVGSPVDPDYFDVYNSDDDTVRRIPRLKRDGTENWDDTDLIAARCEEWIRSKWGSGKPLLVIFAPFAPHGPYGDAYVPKRVENLFEGVSRVPGPYWDAPEHYESTPQSSNDEANRNEYRQKRKEVKVVDDALGAILAALSDTGRMESTYSFFTTDQPYMLGEHGLNKKARFYDYSSRVPLIVRGPGVAENSTTNALASNVDIFPTILEIAGADPSLVAESDGRSLLPAMSQPEAPELWRERVLVTHRAADNFNMIRESRYCYVEFEGNPDDKLCYDMEADPEQITDIYESLDQAEKDRLASALSLMVGCSGNSCRVADRALA